MSNLSKVFDTPPFDPDIPTVSAVALQKEDGYELSPLEMTGDDAEIDAVYVRKNQIELIEISKAAVNTAMRIASESEAPRAVETLAIMLKTASEMNRQLVQQHKDRADVKSAKGGTTPSVGNTTNIMVGSLADVTKMLREAQNKVIEG